MRYMTVLCLALLLSAAALVNAQEPCSPQDIQARIAALQQSYAAGGTAATTAAELQAVNTLIAGIQAVYDQCSAHTGSDSAPDASGEAGTGTLDDPIHYGEAGTTDNVTLKVLATIRPADSIIRRANAFNDRPASEEVYVIVRVVLTCEMARRESCKANFLNFKLVGDEGRVYEVPLLVYNDQINLELLPGASGEGAVPFLVRKTDTNLRLVYYPVSFARGQSLALAIEPRPEEGLIVTTGGSVNVRTGPGTNFDQVTQLKAGQTLLAIGRNEDGSWLRIDQGWVATRLIKTDGDVTLLKVVDE